MKFIKQISMNASTIHVTPMQRALTVKDRSRVHVTTATLAMVLRVRVSFVCYCNIILLVYIL